MGKNKKHKKGASTDGRSPKANVFRISDGRVERLHQVDPMGASWRSYPRSAVRQSVIDRLKTKAESERSGDDWWQLGEYQVIEGLASGDEGVINAGSDRTRTTTACHQQRLRNYLKPCPVFVDHYTATNECGGVCLWFAVAREGGQVRYFGSGDIALGAYPEIDFSQNQKQMRTISSGKVFVIQDVALYAREIVGNTVFDRTVPARYLEVAANI